MKTKQIYDSLEIMLSEEENKIIFQKVKNIIEIIYGQIKKNKVKAEVFVGGSFAKGTLVKRDNYDVDIFVRFDKKYENPDEILKGILEASTKDMKKKLRVVHGSRDYFAIEDDNLIFEIVPVRKIDKPEQSVNSTDLSYFHVKYVTNALKKNPKLKRDVLIAKAFCRARGVYGAESWVRGFSGYALECLVIAYGGFEKMLVALSKAEKQVILDPEKKYKKKDEILIELNESKRKGPIILVDPTYKERNVCSALSEETFQKFRKSAIAFLKKPSIKFFEVQKIDEFSLKNNANKSGSDYVKLIIESNKQEGDIAGAELEKFYRFILGELEELYEIKESIFHFNEKQEAIVYLIVKPNRKAVQQGPPLKMIPEVKIFKQMHKDAFAKSGRLYAPIRVEPIHTFLGKWKSQRLEQIKSMDISEIRIN